MEITDKLLKNDFLLHFEIGDIVKISNGQERFWVKVNKIDGENITGIVDNKLLGDYGYNLGDEISFKNYNVIDVYE